MPWAPSKHPQSGHWSTYADESKLGPGSVAPVWMMMMMIVSAAPAANIIRGTWKAITRAIDGEKMNAMSSFWNTTSANLCLSQPFLSLQIVSGLVCTLKRPDHLHLLIQNTYYFLSLPLLLISTSHINCINRSKWAYANYSCTYCALSIHPPLNFSNHQAVKWN